jgi:photosystem II stability/assembly factor-like uncharacterized protein
MKHPTEKGASASNLKAAKRKRFPIGKAFARTGYFNLQRGVAPPAHAGGRIAAAGSTAAAAERHLRALFKRRKTAPPFTGAAGLPVWRALGPALIPHGQTYGSARPAVSGRCSGVNVDPADPRRIILCSAGGGLWDSIDGGEHWRPITDDQPCLSMGALARAPSAANILYAGTGEGDNGAENSVGLLRSSNGGATWTHVPSAALLGTGIYDIVVHPTDPMRLWIATSAGLFISRDGGSTCLRQRAGHFWSVSINLRNSADLMAAGTVGLLQSPDGGSTWSEVALPGLGDLKALGRLEVCHAPSSAGVAYVTAAANIDDPDLGKGLIWRRTTAGTAFRSLNVPAGMDVNQAWYDWCTAVAPDDPTVVYWGAIELFRGKLGANGKFTWRNISSRKSGDSIHPDQHHLAFDPSDPKVVYACNDGGLFRSADGGGHWKSLNKGLTVTEFEFIAHRSTADDGWIIGGTQDNGTLEYRGAATWDQVGLGDGGDCAAAVGSRGEVAYHSYYYMSLERRLMAPGERWKVVTPPPVRENGNQYADGKEYPCLFYPPMDARADAVAQAGRTLFVSADCGDTWFEVQLPGIETDECASTLAFAGDKVLVVGTARGKTYQVQRGSTGWGNARVTRLKSPRAAYLSDVVAMDAQGTRLWMTCSWQAGARVFFSGDGGKTWSNRTGTLPDAAVNAIAPDPADVQRVFAATDLGVYETTDGGANWRDFSNGLPNAIVGDLIVHGGSRVLRAGTRSRGAWEVSI